MFAKNLQDQGLECIPLISQNMWIKFRGFNERMDSLGMA